MHDCGKVLEVSLRDAKWAALSAEWRPFDVAEHVTQAPTAIDRLIWAGQSLLCGNGRKHTVTHAVASRAAFPHRQVSEARLCKRDVRRHGHRNRVRRLLEREP